MKKESVVTDTVFLAKHCLYCYRLARLFSTPYLSHCQSRRSFSLFPNIQCQNTSKYFVILRIIIEHLLWFVNFFERAI